MRFYLGMQNALRLVELQKTKLKLVLYITVILTSILNLWKKSALRLLNQLRKKIPDFTAEAYKEADAAKKREIEEKKAEQKKGA